MLSLNNTQLLKNVEGLLLKEMQAHGRIMVRSLDMIHAKTGMEYAAVSEIAQKLMDKRLY